jgi:hypothetical protein
MLVSKARETDVIGNRIPAGMAAAEARLELLSEETVKTALIRLNEK